jgi:hypothetical protein
MVCRCPRPLLQECGQAGGAYVKRHKEPKNFSAMASPRVDFAMIA